MHYCRLLVVIGHPCVDGLLLLARKRNFLEWHNIMDNYKPKHNGPTAIIPYQEWKEMKEKIGKLEAEKKDIIEMLKDMIGLFNRGLPESNKNKLGYTQQKQTAHRVIRRGHGNHRKVFENR